MSSFILLGIYEFGRTDWSRWKNILSWSYLNVWICFQACVLIKNHIYLINYLFVILCYQSEEIYKQNFHAEVKKNMHVWTFTIQIDYSFIFYSFSLCSPTGSVSCKICFSYHFPFVTVLFSKLNVVVFLF